MNFANMKRGETTEQIRLFDWAKRHERFIPELKLLHHIPNEGIRTNGPVLKAAGLKAGVPDVSLPVARRGFNGLYIEMKYGKNKPTKEQEEVMAQLVEQGYKVCVCYSFEDAREVIRHYLAKSDDFDLVNCEEAIKIWDECEGYSKEQYPHSPCEGCGIFKRRKD